MLIVWLVYWCNICLVSPNVFHSLIKYVFATSSFLINNNSVLNLKIFPNPSKNIIQIDNLHNSIEYEILTNYGSIIKKGSTNGKVNIEFLSNGIYFLRLKTKFNQQVLKFVKWF